MLWWHWGQCPQHEWEESPGICPYGSTGVFEVTWPNIELARSYNTTHDWDFEPGGVFLGVCIAYSYVPYLIIFKCVFAFLLKRGTRELSILLFFVAASFTAELMVLHTKLLPPQVQKRPEQSCITSCGMPSSKSAITVGCFILRFLDNLTRSRPSCLPSMVPRRPRASRGEGQPTSCYGKITSLLYEAGSAGVPLAAWDEVTGDTHVAFLALWMMLLLPVPMAVVQLKDNTMQQAFYGALAGFFIAIIWTLLTRIVQHRYNQLLGVTLLGCIRHNLALPLFMAERRCAEGNKALARRPSLAASWVVGSAQSARPDRELQWYLDQTNRRRALLSSFGVQESEYLEERAARLEDLIKGLTPIRGAPLTRTVEGGESRSSSKETLNTLQLPSSSVTMTSSMTASRTQETELSFSKPDGRVQCPQLPASVMTTRSDGVTAVTRGMDVSPAVVAARSVRL